MRSTSRMQRDRMSLLARVPKTWTPTTAIRGPYVRGDLDWLERRGFVVSRLNERRGEKRLFFCIKCEQVMTQETYDLPCPPPRDGKHDVRPFYSRIRFKEWRRTAAGDRALEPNRQAA